MTKIDRIEIPFHHTFTSKLGREKTATTRTRRYGKRGDIFEVDKMLFMIMKMKQMSLAEVADYHYEAEGFRSPKEFINAWIKIHPRADWRPEQKVWIHFFQFTY